MNNNSLEAEKQKILDKINNFSLPSSENINEFENQYKDNRELLDQYYFVKKCLIDLLGENKDSERLSSSLAIAQFNTPRWDGRNPEKLNNLTHTYNITELASITLPKIAPGLCQLIGNKYLKNALNYGIVHDLPEIVLSDISNSNSHMSALKKFQEEQTEYAMSRLTDECLKISPDSNMHKLIEYINKYEKRKSDRYDIAAHLTKFLDPITDKEDAYKHNLEWIIGKNLSPCEITYSYQKFENKRNHTYFKPDTSKVNLDEFAPQIREIAFYEDISHLLDKEFKQESKSDAIEIIKNLVNMDLKLTDALYWLKLSILSNYHNKMHEEFGFLFPYNIHFQWKLEDILKEEGLEKPNPKQRLNIIRSIIDPFLDEDIYHQNMPNFELWTIFWWARRRDKLITVVPSDDEQDFEKDGIEFPAIVNKFSKKLYFTKQSIGKEHFTLNQFFNEFVTQSMYVNYRDSLRLE